jgi:Flp pilus assembly protein TadG
MVVTGRIDAFARRFRRARGGMAMVEMVIILPLLLMLLFALVEFGVMFARWQTLSNAAREGAREAVLFRDSCNSSTVQADVRNRVRNYAAPLGITLNDADISVSGQCRTAPNSTVLVSFTHTFNVLPNLAESLSPTIDLSRSSVMRNE